MHRTNGAGHVGHLFVAEDPSINRPPAEITAEWLNAVQEEIANVIEGFGGVLDPLNNAQLLAVIKAKRFNFIAIISSGYFTTSTAITAATIFKITLVGGGAGGGGGMALGGGGGAGGVVEFYISGLLPSTAYPIVIGAAGTGSASPAAGGSGGSTSIVIGGVTYSVGGGIGGNGNTGPNNNTQYQGAASASVLALPNKFIYQSSEAAGSINGSIYVGSNGASTLFGLGGIGGNSTGSAGGSAGIGHGSGGGGGVGGNSGANGTSGLVTLEWIG